MSYTTPDSKEDDNQSSRQCPRVIRLVASEELTSLIKTLAPHNLREMQTWEFKAEPGQLVFLTDGHGELTEVCVGIGERSLQSGLPLTPLLSRITENNASARPTSPASFGNSSTEADSLALLPSIFAPLAKKIPAGRYEIEGLPPQYHAIAARALHQAQYHFTLPSERRLASNLSQQNNQAIHTLENPNLREKCTNASDIAADNPSLRSIQLKHEETSKLIRYCAADKLARDLINTPANRLGPEELADIAKHLASDLEMQYSCISGDALKREYPMIATVGAASEHAPRLIELYAQAPNTSDNGNTAPLICLIGKGVTFDTGGLDIKPSRNMLLMKKDMGGAAHALALAALIRLSKLPVSVRVLIPALENSISSNAYRPGDVLTARNGTTVEVGNTDAEGRLVLADAITDASSQNPDVLITLATLTGAARVAVGPDLPALFSDNDQWTKELDKCGHLMCDPLWRLPLYAGYDQYLRSNVADISSTGSSPFAGASTAALFLRHFVVNPEKWLHLDMYAWGRGPGMNGEAARTQGIIAIQSWLESRFLSS